MDNPAVGKKYKIRDKRTHKETYVKSTMLKVPVDLRCLDNCTTIDFPRFDWNFEPESRITVVTPDMIHFLIATSSTDFNMMLVKIILI